MTGVAATIAAGSEIWPALAVLGVIAALVGIVIGLVVRRHAQWGWPERDRATGAVVLGVLSITAVPFAVYWLASQLAGIGHGRPLVVSGRARTASRRRSTAWMTVEAEPPAGAIPSAGDIRRRVLGVVR